MKRKFSLFVTIVVCLLIAAGILSACNDDSEQDPGVHVHSMELTAAKEATCTEGGNNAYYYCSGCGKYFKDEAGTQETTVEAETIHARHKIVDGKCTICGKLYTVGLKYSLSGDGAYYIVTGIGTASGDIIIPDTHEGLPVTYIGDWAFRDCSSLTSIEIPAGVTSIGDRAFSSCSNLESVTFAEGSQLTTIGGDAFDYCSSLTSIEIPAGVTSIGFAAFSGCSNLNTVYYAGSIEDWFNIEFEYSSSNPLCNGADLYIGGELVTEVVVPESITTIGYQLTGCTSLTSITIHSGVTSIGNWAFYECSSLTSIEIPAGVTSIGDSAFAYCSSLTSIEIPAGVTSIGSWAFGYCSNLEIIYYNGTAEQWNAIEKVANWDLNCGNYEVVFLGDAGAEGGEG